MLNCRGTLIHGVSQRGWQGVVPQSALIESEASYAVFRTRQNEVSEVFNVGRYIDVVRRTADGLRFASRICVFDSEMIPTSIIYPI